MRRWPCRTWGGIAALATVAGLATPAVAATARPQTIPALRIWHGGGGALALPGRLRIVVPARWWRRLRPTAYRLAGDLRAQRRPARVTRGGPPRPGDIVLELGASDRRLGSEGYQLAVRHRLIIRARTETGAFYGTRTVLQLLRGRRGVPRGRAADWPRYPIRGLMIDLGRRVYPADWIESEIKQLAYLKLNLLHLHLTDDQRWGVQSDTHPEVVSPQALTKVQVRRILAMAAAYHVTVVPEIDMPAHVGSLLAKHPELELKAASAASPPPQSPEARKLDISNPVALAAVRQLLDEYLPLFTGPYWDVGGDEYLNPQDQPLYPQLTTYAQSRYGSAATTQDAIIGFFNWVDGIVRTHGKTLWAWHDELGDGSVLRVNRDVAASWWVQFSPLSSPMPPTPDQLLAAGHRIVNDGWFPTYWTEDLGPIQGKPSLQKAYEQWEVSQFCGPTANDQYLSACYSVSPSEPGNLGSTINAWDDHELTLDEVRAGLLAALMVLAQKTWESPELTASYAGFQQVMSRVGSAAS